MDEIQAYIMTNWLFIVYKGKKVEKGSDMIHVVLVINMTGNSDGHFVEGFKHFIGLQRYQSHIHLERFKNY